VVIQVTTRGHLTTGRVVEMTHGRGWLTLGPQAVLVELNHGYCFLVHSLYLIVT